MEEVHEALFASFQMKCCFFLPPFLEHYVDSALRDIMSFLTTTAIMSRALEILKAHLSLLHDNLNIFKLLTDLVHISLKAFSSDLMHIDHRVGAFAICSWHFKSTGHGRGSPTAFSH